jgi:hypothetical protein
MPRLALKPTLFDTLGDKAGGIVGQIGYALSLRLNAQLLDEKNLKQPLAYAGQRRQCVRRAARHAGDPGVDA